MKNHSYFSFGPGINPLYYIDKWLNPYFHKKEIEYKEHSLTIEWTKRANKVLFDKSESLIVEMQLYFSCVVKKRVIFTEKAEFNVIPVTDNLSIAFHAVEAASCDPVEFAKNFPAKREFDSIASSKMHPRQLKIDFINNSWRGEFYI